MFCLLIYFVAGQKAIIKQPAVIKFHANLAQVAQTRLKLYKKCMGVFIMAKDFWMALAFLEGEQLLEEEKLVRWPITIWPADSIQKVPEFISKDCSVTLRVMEQALHIDEETIWQILKEYLGKTNDCGKFVLHIPTLEQKLMKLEDSSETVRAANNSSIFLIPIVTGDETWYCQYDLQTNVKVPKGRKNHHLKQKKRKKFFQNLRRRSLFSSIAKASSTVSSSSRVKQLLLFFTWEFYDD